MDDNSKAYSLLDRLFELWTDINYDEDGNEYRYPANRRQVSKSKKILEKIRVLEITDEALIRRIEIAEERTTNGDVRFPNYRTNIITSIVFFLITIAVLFGLVRINTYSYPHISYDPEQFITTKSYQLKWTYKEEDNTKEE